MIREWNEESLDHRNTLLYAMGISEEDAQRPIIGLVNTWNEMNPGHFPFDKALIWRWNCPSPASVTASAATPPATATPCPPVTWFPARWRPWRN